MGLWTLLSIIFVVLIGAGGVVAVLIGIPGFGGFGGGERGTAMRNLQNPTAERGPRGVKPTINEVVDESKAKSRVTAELTLEKRIKYARLPITPAIYWGAAIGVSILTATVLGQFCNFLVIIFSLISGPLLVGTIVNFCMNRRSSKFDADYPSFLLSLVGLLKTGMNPVQALEAASQGLEEGSLLKLEIQVMLERLRLGVTEEKSVGSFGEDIYHPEIELFVQALLLNRRVGGGLSDTLERLAKQVRKRQYFRLAAISAVAMQRGSIWVIIGILVAIEGYLFMMYPSMVTEAMKSPVGWNAWQGGIVVILIGILWVRAVTKIKV